jgi:hypothetical protein
MQIDAMILRGGTSKGVFFRADDLPNDESLRDKILLKIVGSPDSYARQLDGLGSATSSTSKIVIVSKSKRDGFDVDYLFGHIAIDRPIIDYSGNCGNLSSAVGVFAIESGLIEVASDSKVEIKIWQENIQKPLITKLFTDKNGLAKIDGDCKIAGVMGSYSPIEVEFLEPSDNILPTGNSIDIIKVSNKEFRVTLIDSGNLTIFIDSKELGLRGDELPSELDSNIEVMELLEEIRSICGSIITGKSVEHFKNEQLATPKISIIAEPKEYICSNGELIAKDNIDILARIISMGKAHQSYTGTGAIALATASQIANSVISPYINIENSIRIGHSSGILVASAKVEKNRAFSASFTRTARVLMKGQAIIGDVL